MRSHQQYPWNKHMQEDDEITNNTSKDVKKQQKNKSKKSYSFYHVEGSGQKNPKLIKRNVERYQVEAPKQLQTKRIQHKPLEFKRPYIQQTKPKEILTNKYEYRSITPLSTSQKLIPSPIKDLTTPKSTSLQDQQLKFQPLDEKLKNQTPSQKKILVLQNKLAEAEFKIKSLQKFQNQKEAIYNEKSFFEKLFQESNGLCQKLQEQNTHLKKQNEEYKKMAIKENVNGGIIDHNSLTQYAKQIQRLKSVVKNVTEENQKLKDNKQAKTQLKQKEEKLKKTEQKLQQKTNSQITLKKELENKKKQIEGVLKQLQDNKKTIKRLQNQINQYEKDKEIVLKRQMQNIGLCKFCLTNKAKFVNVQCGHVNLCDVCVKHEICMDACMICKTKGKYREIFCSVIKN